MLIFYLIDSARNFARLLLKFFTAVAILLRYSSETDLEARKFVHKRTPPFDIIDYPRDFYLLVFPDTIGGISIAVPA